MFEDVTRDLSRGVIWDSNDQGTQSAKSISTKGQELGSPMDMADGTIFSVFICGMDRIILEVCSPMITNPRRQHLINEYLYHSPISVNPVTSAQLTMVMK